MLAVAAAAHAWQTGQARAEETVDAAFARMDADHAAAACFLRRDREHARAAASRLDVLHPRQPPGSGVAGVLVAHKDLFAQREMVATFGAHSAFHRRGTRDASALAKLAAAGAIDLGALHMAEFAMGPAGCSSAYGYIDNPAAPDRVSGGSSSGSAAAVACGIVAAALGTDTGGSIRIPAAFCGAVGMKPSNGLVATDGVFPVSATLDCVGPIAADVGGVARLLDVLTGSTEAPGTYERGLTADFRGVRVGVLDAASLPVPPDDAVGAAWLQAAERLGRAGVPVIEVRFPELASLNALAGTVFLSEAAAVHADALRAAPDHFGPQVRDRLLQGLRLPAATYLCALEVRAAWLARWQHAVSGCDVVLLPVTPTPAPLRSYYTNAASSTATILDHNSRLGSYTPAFNYLGLPVLAMPLGGTLGVQLVGAPLQDLDTLRVGAALELALRA